MENNRLFPWLKLLWIEAWTHQPENKSLCFSFPSQKWCPRVHLAQFQWAWTTHPCNHVPQKRGQECIKTQWNKVEVHNIKLWCLKGNGFNVAYAYTDCRDQKYYPKLANDTHKRIKRATIPNERWGQGHERSTACEISPPYSGVSVPWPITTTVSAGNQIVLVLPS